VILEILLLAPALWAWDAGSEAAALERHSAGGVVESARAQVLAESVAVAPRAVAPRTSSLESDRIVRIALRDGVAKLEVQLEGAFIAGGKPIANRTISVSKDRLDESGIPLEPDGSLLISPIATLSAFRIGTHTYRGALRVRSIDRSLAAINEISLEDYVKGVVPGEIGRKLDPRLLEAVKAQAIVARTYAVRAQGQYGSKPWDLRDDTRDQMYEGRSGEDPLCTRASSETRGQILTDRSGKPIDAYYHSTSGGATADISEVWPGKTVRPYLRGVEDTAPDGRAWGAFAPSASWTETWPEKVLLASVRRDLPSALAKPCDPGEVHSLSIEGHDGSGRARKLVVRGKKGVCEAVGDRIRWALKRPGGKGILRSARFSLEHVDSRYVARGTGNGHGVGLSQTGAIGRARAGQRVDFILTSYYPGTVLAQVVGSTGSLDP